jgi:hypothetical protein
MSLEQELTAATRFSLAPTTSLGRPKEITKIKKMFYF